MTEVVDELHFRRLLVAIDGSESSRLALAAAVTVARRDNAAITLICVAPDVAANAARWSWLGQAPPTSQESEDTTAARILRTAVAATPDDIGVTTVVRRGRPGAEIVAQSKAQDYDAILIGSRGVGRVEAIFGSVSSYVMHAAAIPVFVAHAPNQ